MAVKGRLENVIMHVLDHKEIITFLNPSSSCKLLPSPPLCVEDFELLYKNQWKGRIS